MADVIASKFVDALSFHRKDKILQREGIDIGYSTLCEWPIQLTQRLQPIKNIQAHGGCWAHLRRKFSDAAKGRRHANEAHTVLTMIAALYKLDKALDGLTGEKKVEERRQKVKPHLEDIKQYLDQLATQFVSQGLMNTAIHYALNNWHKFTAFIDHAALPLDNNAIERQIRPFTLGRRNWLFSGSPRGAEASAFLYSLIETAKANSWEPKAYLQTLFELYPQAKTEGQRRELLPMFLKPSK